ncbi:MAG: hypothetical protein ACI9IL_000386 [Rickettsiales bacterium]|jgi:hypothetical protein
MTLTESLRSSTLPSEEGVVANELFVGGDSSPKDESEERSDYD